MKREECHQPVKRPERKRRSPEAELQKRMVQHLATALTGAAIVPVANENLRHRGDGIFEGYPDLVVHWRGLTFCIEVKTADGQLKPEQAAAHKVLARNRIKVFVLWRLHEIGRVVLYAKTEAERLAEFDADAATENPQAERLERGAAERAEKAERGGG